MDSLVLRGLSAGLDFDARGGVFEAQEKVTGMFNVLRTFVSGLVREYRAMAVNTDVPLQSWSAHS